MQQICIVGFCICIDCKQSQVPSSAVCQVPSSPPDRLFDAVQRLTTCQLAHHLPASSPHILQSPVTQQLLCCKHCLPALRMAHHNWQ
jgi:hypothetical protein